jgi:hypothetical protein
LGQCQVKIIENLTGRREGIAKFGRITGIVHHMLYGLVTDSTTYGNSTSEKYFIAGNGNEEI